MKYDNSRIGCCKDSVFCNLLDPEGKNENIVGEEKQLLIVIFSFCHNVFYTSKNNCQF